MNFCGVLIFEFDVSCEDITCKMAAPSPSSTAAVNVHRDGGPTDNQKVAGDIGFFGSSRRVLRSASGKSMVALQLNRRQRVLEEREDNHLDFVRRGYFRRRRLSNEKLATGESSACVCEHEL